MNHQTKITRFQVKKRHQFRCQWLHALALFHLNTINLVLCTLSARLALNSSKSFWNQSARPALQPPVTTRRHQTPSSEHQSSLLSTRGPSPTYRPISSPTRTMFRAPKGSHWPCKHQSCSNHSSKAIRHRECWHKFNQRQHMGLKRTHSRLRCSKFKLKVNRPTTQRGEHRSLSWANRKVEWKF